MILDLKSISNGLGAISALIQHLKDNYQLSLLEINVYENLHEPISLGVLKSILLMIKNYHTIQIQHRLNDEFIKLD